MVKPLLVIPPAPARWSPLDELLREYLPPRWLHNLEQRVRHGVSGATDAIVVIPAGGNDLAAGWIHKTGELGLLGSVYTRPEHRTRGLARRIIETALSWFDMTGGKWLYLSATRELEDEVFHKFGFELLRQAAWEPHDRMTLVRRSPGVTGEPVADASQPVTVRDIARGEWVDMVAVLQSAPGPDPRVPLGESAVAAEVLALDLVDHQERGACQLKGAFRGTRLVAFATVATDQPGQRSYAMLIPHTDAPAELRQAVIDFAASHGYSHVDFPMEALGAARS